MPGYQGDILIAMPPNGFAEESRMRPQLICCQCCERLLTASGAADDPTA